MTTESSWNDNYAEGGCAPWDTGAPDPMLVELLTSGALPAGRALDIGCGTGTNAIWLAERGYDVLGVDLASLAIGRARAKTPPGLCCRFDVLDILAAAPAGGPYQLVFDRGCFHVFDDAAERARFAAQVASVLGPEGLWVSLIGSTEGGPRDFGPPRRSAREVVMAIEPALEIVSLRAQTFGDLPVPVMAWVCLSRRREAPAAPSGH